MSNTPTRKLRVIDTDNAVEEILAFGKHLEAEGERPWFEVWYPAPGRYLGTAEEWDQKQAEAFDAVEIIDGEIVTLPPYSELEVVQ